LLQAKAEQLAAEHHFAASNAIALNGDLAFALKCFPSPEIQTITTSAVDINEIQHIIIDSSYQGHGIVREIQLVQCDATGGIFGLSFEGDIAYISHDSNEEDIKSSLESLNKIYSVTVSFNQGINPLALIKAETLLLHLIH